MASPTPQASRMINEVTSNTANLFQKQARGVFRARNTLCTSSQYQMSIILQKTFDLAPAIRGID